MQKQVIISGSFKVEMTPKIDDKIAAGRMILDKTYSGAMSGKGRGQMLSKRTITEGSAGYVAIEEFAGTLDNKEGGFTLLHTGIMDRGTPSLSVQIIPDSGTGKLVGLSGTMVINAENGRHTYKLTYSIE